MKTTYKLFFGLVVVALVGAGGWWAFRSQSSDDLGNLSTAAGTKLTDSQVQAVIARVGKFMVIPSDEKPSVAILHGVKELAAQQPFYRDAKEGDILVVYSSRAIIFDAKANKLVSVSPIQQNTATPVPTAIASGSAQPSLSPTASGSAVLPEKVTVEVRNGTSTSGLAGKTASDLDAKFDWITKPTTGDAKALYKTTTVVDLSGGKKPGAVAALEKYFSVKAVTALPTGEAASKADILIIVGK